MARSSGVLAGALALPLGLLACNAITGISDYDAVECPGRRCPRENVRPDASNADGGDAGDAVAPPGSDPVVWPTFEMPNNKPGSPVGAPNVQKLQAAGDTVVDEITKLVWQKRVLGQGLGTVYEYADARDACAALPGGTWRLPKRIELVTLLSYGHGAPFVDQALLGVPAAVVWTSSEVRRRAGDASRQAYWVVDFRTGAVEQRVAEANSGAHALCVKGK